MPFSDVWSSLQSTFDANYGERLEIHQMLPRARGNQVGVSPADPAFPPFVALGILKIGEQAAEVKGGRLDASKSVIQVEQSSASFAALQFNAAQPAPREGTRIVALDRAPVMAGGVMGPPIYVVDTVKPDGLCRLVCILRD